MEFVDPLSEAAAALESSQKPLPTPDPLQDSSIQETTSIEFQPESLQDDDDERPAMVISTDSLSDPLPPLPPLPTTASDQAASLAVETDDDEPVPTLSQPTPAVMAVHRDKNMGPRSDIDALFSSMTQRQFFPLVETGSYKNPTRSVIYISEAIKISEHNGGAFIAYVIHTEPLSGTGKSWIAKRRYSEFEQFRKLLSRLYPTICVPTLPEKHSLSDYAAKQKKAKEDVHVIEKRKRMLKTFLVRVAAHPLLGKSHLLHQFLEGVSTWNEIMTSSGLTYLFKQNSMEGLGKSSLKQADPHFLAAEDFTFRFSHQIHTAHKAQKRISKGITDMAALLSEMGGCFNGWSLIETELGSRVEKVGEAIDNTVAATSALAQALDETFTEPLQEYTQLSKSVERVLRYRDRKQEELESFMSCLEEKTNLLKKLESSENESQRISAVLSAEGSTRKVDTVGPPISRPQGLIATLNSFIDNDPEQSRRNKISRTKDRIVTLTDQVKRAQMELENTNKDVQMDLDRFQRDKMADFRNMFLNFALAQRDYHQKALKSWKEARTQL